MDVSVSDTATLIADPVISVDRLMERIRDEVARRQGQPGMTPESPASHFDPVAPASEITDLPPENAAEVTPPVPGRLALAAIGHSSVGPPLEPKGPSSYHLNDLLPYDGIAFVNAAYRAALGRDADAEGLNCYSTMLRDGASKAEIIGRLCKSREGRARRAKVAGVTLRYWLDVVSRWPIIGRLVEIPAAIWNLRRNERNYRRQSAETADRLVRGEQKSAQAATDISEALLSVKRSHDITRAQVMALQQTAAGTSKSLSDMRTALTAKVDQKQMDTKADRGELDHWTAKLSALMRTMEATKADASEVAGIQLAMHNLAQCIAAVQEAKVQLMSAMAVKVDPAALEALRDESKSNLNAAIEQIRVQVLRAMDTKTERHEVTALLQTITEALAKTGDAIADVRNSKADADDLARLRTTIANDTRVSLDVVNRTVHSLMSSKADKSALSGFRDDMDGAETARRKSVEELNQTIEVLSRTKADRATVEALKVEAKAAIEEANVHVMEVLAPVTSRTQDLSRTLLDQERQIGALLEEAGKRLPEPVSFRQIGQMLTEEEHQLDAMYASFEDRFRGTRSDIRQRQAIYLSYMREAKAGAAAAPVVDLGCGRGEWLELLRSEGFIAKGVDRNRIFLAGCRELDLDVAEEDAVTFLRQLEPGSIGAVTAFHLIEHLPHRSLVALIDETLRVLQPGGVVIFETPNPRNLIVAGCNFYLDPTHRHPLPPDLSRYLLEARGFCSVGVKEIHPFGSAHQIVDGDKRVKEVLNQYLFSAQDYAVIGRKAA